MKHKIKSPGNFSYILKFALSPRLWFVILIPLLTIAVGQRPIAASWLTAQIFNKLQLVVTGNRDVSLLHSAVFFGVLLFLVDIVQWLFNTVSDLIENYWREYVNVILQKRFLVKDYKLDIKDFDQPELQSRRLLAQGIDPVGQIKAVISCISQIIVAVSFAVIMFRYNPLLILFTVAAKFPSYFLKNKINHEERKFRIETDVITREKNYYKAVPVDRYSAKEFKLFNMKDYICEKYDQTVGRYYQKFKRKYVKNSAENMIMGHYDRIITIIFQIVTGLPVFMGKVLFGDYTLVLAAFTNLSDSVESLTDYASQFKDMREQNRMLREYLDDLTIFESAETADMLQVTGGTHTIELRNVSFAYPGTKKEILHELNMTISSGKTYGLVGLNGSGKSTLVNLLLRLHEPDSGEILLDGINIKEYNIRSYYAAIACVFQFTTKYSMPIGTYIASGRQCDTQRAESAIDQVKLSNWFSELPHGLDTMLTRAFACEHDSVEPSIGQWQKLSIARAIYKDAPIMILDEPSASLDVDTENEIFDYIAQLTVKKTALLISHRLSNIIKCDYIYLLQDGKVAEQGTHQELMMRDGVYAELFKSQAKYYKTA